MSDAFINGVLGVLDHDVEAQGRPVLMEDPDILTTIDVINGLKSGSVPGTAIVSWADSDGTLEANVIDFLMQEQISARDTRTGEHVKVDSKLVPDGAWKLFS